MIKRLYFDFDGTISDARNIATTSLIETLNELGYHYNKQKALRLLGAKFEELIKELGLPASQTPRMRTKFYKHFNKKAKEGKIKLCVSTKPLYKLKKTYPLTIVSHSRKDFLTHSIKQLRIQRLFNELHGSDSFSTKDKKLRQLFKKHKIKPQEAAYIGDRYSDVLYAKKAGCHAIAIHNKCAWSSITEIKKVKPDAIIKDFRQLQKTIKELEKKHE
jgi:phosphoglycolate phosphatase-like HAD superfamily hydrolase